MGASSLLKPRRTRQTCYQMKWITRGLEWRIWQKSAEAVHLRDDLGAIEDATPEQLQRLLTVWCDRNALSMEHLKAPQEWLASEDAQEGGCPRKGPFLWRGRMSGGEE